MALSEERRNEIEEEERLRAEIRSATTQGRREGPPNIRDMPMWLWGICILSALLLLMGYYPGWKRANDAARARLETGSY